MSDFDVELSRPNFFCYSLRKRHEWVTIASQLLQSPKGKWQERNLGSHDIELSPPHSPSLGGPHFIRLILLTAKESEEHESMYRVDRLLNHDNGRHSAIIFLLGDDENTKEHAYQAFTGLQMRRGPMIHLETCDPSLTPRYENRVLQSKATSQIIPLLSLTQLPAVLETFQSSLTTSQSRQQQQEQAQRVDAVQDLLSYCTFTPTTPLPRQTTRILQENSHSLRDLVDQSRSDQGRERIWRAVEERAGGGGGGGVSEGEKFVSFWSGEFTAL